MGAGDEMSEAENIEPGSRKAGEIRILLEAPPEYLLAGKFWGYAGRAEVFVGNGVVVLVWVTVVKPWGAGAKGSIRLSWPDRMAFEYTPSDLKSGKVPFSRDDIDAQIRETFRKHVASAQPWGRERLIQWELAHPGWGTWTGEEPHQQQPLTWSWNERAPIEVPRRPQWYNPGPGAQVRDGRQAPPMSDAKSDPKPGPASGDTTEEFRTHWQRQREKAEAEARRAREMAEKLRREREEAQRKQAEEAERRRREQEERAHRQRQKEEERRRQRGAGGFNFTGEKVFEDFFNEFFGRGSRKQREAPPPSGSTKNPWEVLGVPRGSPKEAVQKAYRDKARENHPDKYATAPEAEKRAAESRMKDVNVAWDDIRSMMEW